MVSKSKANFILSLQKRKEREKEKLFVIEGDKLVREFLLAKINLRILIARPEFINSLPESSRIQIGETESASYEELKKLSSMKTPQNALAVVGMPEYRTDKSGQVTGLTAALDFIQDPGNLGTIIRAAAWFGISDIVCSDNSVDVFNPKVIQSTMGAILNVRVHYCDLKEYLKEVSSKNIPVYGTFLVGESIYSCDAGKEGVILLGNESKGISEDLIPFVTKKLMIPKFTNAVYGIDSLNVSMAASIVFSEFARRSGEL